MVGSTDLEGGGGGKILCSSTDSFPLPVSRTSTQTSDSFLMENLLVLLLNGVSIVVVKPFPACPKNVPILTPRTMMIIMISKVTTSYHPYHYFPVKVLERGKIGSEKNVLSKGHRYSYNSTVSCKWVALDWNLARRLEWLYNHFRLVARSWR